MFSSVSVLHAGFKTVFTLTYGVSQNALILIMSRMLIQKLEITFALMIIFQGLQQRSDKNGYQ